jgi:hypothetical protein
MTILELLSELGHINPNDIAKHLNDENVNDSESSQFEDNICPGFILDLNIGGELIHGIVLANKALMLIDPKTHTVKGYLKEFTNTVPYVVDRIRKPITDCYKYTSNMPVVWEKKSSKKEMSISDIEKALGLESGTLIIK